MTQHTPGPWTHTGTDFINKARLIDHEDGMIEVYGKNREANAAFIVRACNSHDALVQALEHLLTACPKLNFPDDNGPAKTLARAALALARGE